ncbi:MAG: hypothetical protein MHMPM18_001396 [Marteilia pararefringens]
MKVIEEFFAFPAENEEEIILIEGERAIDALGWIFVNYLNQNIYNGPVIVYTSHQIDFNSMQHSHLLKYYDFDKLKRLQIIYCCLEELIQMLFDSLLFISFKKMIIIVHDIESYLTNDQSRRDEFMLEDVKNLLLYVRRTCLNQHADLRCFMTLASESKSSKLLSRKFGFLQKKRMI